MRLQNSPRFHNNVINLPQVDGVSWKADGEDVESGNLPQLKPGDSVTIEAILDDGVITSGTTEWTFSASEEDTDKAVQAPAPQRTVPPDHNMDTGNDQ